MLHFIDSKDDVLALKISGKITGDDLKAIMERLETVMARHQIVHVFVESQSIEGIELAALPGHAVRAMPLFGKLNRFGRVAVAADQSWIRAGTRMESALLPGISYRVFKPEERDTALAFVEGRAAG